MRFLKTLAWVLVAVAFILFAIANWSPVTVNLWGGLALDTKLPVLLFFVFLLGLLPTLLLHRTTRWSMRRKLDSAERALSDIRPPEAPKPEGVIPPAAAPIAVPPGV